VTEAERANPAPEFLLLTDADIQHHPTSVRRLVARAEHRRLDLVSLMVLLRVATFWERLLVPAFVFFFQKLYPFPRVNDPKARTAAAAGGCMLVRADALRRAGGLPAIRGALIDDCALARLLKESHPAGVWLGLTEDTVSLRPYESLGELWDMVARTAYTQLHHSPAWLALAVGGMTLTYVLPPVAALWGAIAGSGPLLVAGGAAWMLMTVCYQPTLALYRLAPAQGLLLPVAAVLYTAMTVSSAWRHVRGRGGAWKGRTYAAPQEGGLT
jgi:hopene-associated glycosyltransferase HpnB